MLDAPRWLLERAACPLIPLEAPLKALLRDAEPRDVSRLPTRSPPRPASADPLTPAPRLPTSLALSLR